MTRGLFTPQWGSKRATQWYTLYSSGVDPYGTGGGHAYECPPPNIWEFLFLTHQYLAAT